MLLFDHREVKVKGTFSQLFCCYLVLIYIAHYEASHFSIIVRLFYRQIHFLKIDFSSLELYTVQTVHK